MNLNEYIEGQAPYGWNLEKESGEGGTLSLRWRVLAGEADTHTAALNSRAAGEGFSYTLVTREKEEDATGGTEVVYGYRDALRELEDVPCFLRSNLPLRARFATAAAVRWGLTAMVDAADVLEACATAAARAGITLDYSGLDAGLVSVPLLDNGSSVKEVLDEVGRRVPNYTTRVAGNTVSVCGGRGELLGEATRARAVVQCSPDMKAGTLTVGSTVVDLAAVYAMNRARAVPLNWYASCARLICDALAGCAEADAMQQGLYIFLTAREAGEAGNDIALAYNGTPAGGTAARAALCLPDDLAQAGTLTDGETELELDADGGTAAGGCLLYEMEGQGFEVGGVYFTPPDTGEVDSVDAWNAVLEDAGCPVRCTGVVRGPDGFAYQANIEALEPGAGGNEITLEPDAGNRVSGETLTGGAEGTRSVDDLADAINAEDDFPFTAVAAGGTAASGSVELAAVTLNIGMVTVVKDGEQLARASIMLPAALRTAAGVAARINASTALSAVIGAAASGNVLTVTAKEAGSGMNGAEVQLQVSATVDTITLEGGEDGNIVLTAKEAGSEGNGIGVQATGCFGSAGQFSGGTDASGIPCVLTPFSGGGGTEVRAPYDGLLGMRAREDLPGNFLVGRRTVRYDAGDLAPTCVVGVQGVGGAQSVVFTVPAGASPYQRGALVVDVETARTRNPQRESEDWEYDPERAKELAREQIRNAVSGANTQQEKTLPWMLVKGAPIPPGWDIASGNVKMNEPHAKDADKWQRFWAQFGAFGTLKRISSGIGFGKPYFFPVEAEDAYPPDAAPAYEEDKAKMGRPLDPAISETSNVPANYKVLGPRDNMHYLVEGSFPASSKSGGNVGGLKFCKGCLKQYVFINDRVQGITAQEAMDFFPGSYKYTVKDGKGRDKVRTCRFTCLKLEGVFINRARKRYQVGTNRQAPSDPDYDEDKDGGAGWYMLGDRTEDDPQPEQGLTLADYIEAAAAFLEACGQRGGEGRTEEVTAHVQGGDFDTGLTVDDVFAALEMEPAASGGYSYDAETRTLTARGSAGQRANFELDDFLTRRRAAKAAQWLDWKERHRDAAEREPRDGDGRDVTVSYPLTPQERQEEREKHSYPMVSGGVNASSGVSSESKPLNPFQVYADGDQWFINEGEMSSPKYGTLKWETMNITQYWKENRSFYVKVVPAVGGGWALVLKWRDREEEEEEE